jgi:nicotinamide phosphoribosyltransferase
MIYNTDSYNLSHKDMFPSGTTEISGYIECRDNCLFEKLVFFGLQAMIKQKLINENPADIDIDEAEAAWNAHGEPFNRKGWEKIKQLGYYPVEIQAVPEGMCVPKGNVLIQIRSTDPDCFWLPTWLETEFDQIWYPIAVCTKDKLAKNMLKRYLEDTGCENIEGVLPFMLHDFGYRACTCREQAMIGGAAHLVNFMGTDTFIANKFLEKYYHANPVTGYSIPASNHAVITSWGQENEAEAFQNILDQFLKSGSTVACVSDSYDIFKAIDTWGTRFRKQIEDSGGRLVIRPDSGSPEYVLLACITKLFSYFGYTTTRTGHRLLPNCVRMIWGDGLDLKRIDEILYFLTSNNVAAENFAFGMGSGMLQKDLHRDTVSLAFKVNERVTNGERIPVFKNPVTGRGKASKAGRQALVNCDGYTFTILEINLENRKNLLRTVYINGKLIEDDSINDIQARANQGYD